MRWMLWFAALLTMQAQNPQERLYVVTHVDLMPPFAEEGGKLLSEFAAQARRDPGAVRFEVLVEPARRNHLTLVTVWESREAFDRHLAAEHTRAFRQRLQPMLGSPFDERLHVQLP
jgi:quinol monooxygenase YgiN